MDNPDRRGIRRTKWQMRQARDAAIKQASYQVRTGSAFMRRAFSCQDNRGRQLEKQHQKSRLEVPGVPLARNLACRQIPMP